MRVERLESSVESRRPVRSRLALRARNLTSDLRPLTSSPSGVTLIELLITIMIISILAAAVLGVAAVAGETAREAKTRSIVSRIHSLLMEQYDTYANRRVKLQQTVTNSISGLNANTAVKGRLKAEARLYALREMMLMEVPDRWSDVLLNTVSDPPATAISLSPLYLDVSNSTNSRTELANVYLRTFRRIAAGTNKISGTANTQEEILGNQSAECLYLVVMNACGDGESRTLFPESSIGDVDGDGAPEFIDGWGHPIEFIRWAAGFESDIQTNANDLDAAADLNQAWANAGAADHDAFDLYRAQPVAFRLVPLVYSFGRDEESGLYDSPADLPWRPNPVPALSLTTNLSGSPPYVRPALNPYVKYLQYFGTAVDRTLATDNITNHLISTKPNP